MFRTTYLLFLLGAAVVASQAQTNWQNPKTMRLVVTEKGDLVTEKQITVYRKGGQMRIEGTFPVGGALAKTPHVRLISGEGSFLYVPSLNAALAEPGITASDRIEVAFPANVKKALFSAPASLLQKELQRPAKFEGEDTVVGRKCYLLTTTDPRSNVHQEKQWIDQTYGLVLRYQRIEAGKVVYSREVIEATFNEPMEDSLFGLPEGTTLVQGGVSAAALERVRTLGDRTQYEAELASVIEKFSKTLNLSWVATITPPEKFRHASTVHRTMRSAGGNEPKAIRPFSGGTPGGPPPAGQQRIWVDPEGNRVTVTIVDDGAGMESPPGVPRDRPVIVQAQVTTAGGEPDIQVLEGPPPPDREQREANLTPEMRQRLQELREARRAATSQQPNEGVFVSEFIDPESGKTIVFVQSKDNDPTSTLSARGPLGDSEKVTVAGVEGTLFTGGKPGGRVSVIWKQNNTWFGLSSVGLTKDELLQIAGTVKRFR